MYLFLKSFNISIYLTIGSPLFVRSSSHFHPLGVNRPKDYRLDFLWFIITIKYCECGEFVLNESASYKTNRAKSFNMSDAFEIW